MASSADKRGWRARMVVLLPYLWLGLFFLAPFVIVLKISLSQAALAQPPYVPVFDLSAGWAVERVCGEAFRQSFKLLGSDAIYLLSYFKSLEVAAVSTAILVLIGYPVAYGIACAPRAWQPLLVMAIILPFWTSFLIRVYAWINILQRDGLLNDILLRLHIIDAPVVWLSSDTAIYIGVVYSYLPFMVLPLYAVLEKMDGKPAGGGRGSRLSTLESVLACDVSAVVARPRCRGATLLHSDRWRIRHSGSAWRFGDADDRADAVD